MKNPRVPSLLFTAALITGVAVETHSAWVASMAVVVGLFMIVVLSTGVENRIVAEIRKLKR